MKIFKLFILLLCVSSPIFCYQSLKPGTTWQLRAWCGPDENCHSQSVTGKTMVDVDLFDTSKSTIANLASSHIVICYFSAGSYESWRSDANTFPSSVKGVEMDGWDETWLDIRNLQGLQPIMSKRIALAKSKGCHGVEPDNVDCWSNKCVSGVKAGDNTMYNAQIVYNKWLAAEAHKNDLSIGLKNDLDQIKDLINDFDWAINEQCFAYDECDSLNSFIQQGKAVFTVEYEGTPSQFCPKAKSMKFMTKYDKNGAWVDC